MNPLPEPVLVELIGFTGHRDCVVDERLLDMVRDRHPQAIWVHGGCPLGYDQQVDDYARTHGIRRIAIRPKSRTAVDYLARDREIVEVVSVLYACYDGRQTGGTFYTRKYALSKGVPVRDLRPQKVG
jgi:hypothetical protein